MGGDTFLALFSYLASLGRKIVIGLGKRVCNIASSGVFQSISTCFATKVVRGLVNFARKKNWDILARAASMYIRFIFLFHDSPSKAAVPLVWLLVVGLALVYKSVSIVQFQVNRSFSPNFWLKSFFCCWQLPPASLSSSYVYSSCSPFLFCLLHTSVSHNGQKLMLWHTPLPPFHSSAILFYPAISYCVPLRSIPSSSSSAEIFRPSVFPHYYVQASIVNFCGLLFVSKGEIKYKAGKYLFQFCLLNKDCDSRTVRQCRIISFLCFWKFI